jgi:hypothetical protein
LQEDAESTAPGKKGKVNTFRLFGTNNLKEGGM